MYLDLAKGMDVQISTLAHEFVHGQFLPAPGDARHVVWLHHLPLEEMSAVMVEDVLGERITPATTPRATSTCPPGWPVRASTATNRMERRQNLFGYNVVDAYGAYLLRQSA